ncbi:hypothetical protein KVR01_005804 [Diaporthe batatas]|uniref:uncharacterized protein n=1 Tax=Diaporthe batatas TaxID=748121 RepID=UPI001D04F3F1|nr:uncharacterized protein KVR01_005804 [Diaporthe batatas]KAG8163886.1 hypothetical protein KVR01_005804 [Diaporthe batatas]
MARVAKIKAKVEAMSLEERDVIELLGMGGPSKGVGPEEAMRRLEEIESGRYDNDSEEDDEVEKPVGAEGGGQEVTDEKKDVKDKTSPEAGGAQGDKEKAAKEKHG